MIQLQFLNKVLSTGDASLITLNDLNKDFFSDYYGEFEFIKNHINQYGKVPDRTTFLSRFPNFDIFEVKENDKYLLDTLYEDRNKRQLAKTFNRVREALNANDIDKAMRVFSKAQEDITSVKHLEAVNIFEDTSRYDSYIERTKDISKFYIHTGFPELDDIMGGWDRKEELAVIMARTNTGKCLAKGTKVLMADGTTKKVEDIVVGDKVQSLNRVNNVLALHNGVSGGYKITPKNGEPFIISDNHILTLFHRSDYTKPGELIDISIEDFINLRRPKSPKNTSTHWEGNSTYMLYKPSIDYPTKNLKIPPYILGVWLGDGSSCRVELTNINEEVINEWFNYSTIYGEGYHINKYKDEKGKENTFDITKIKKGPGNKFVEDFKSYDLINNKHIPLDYLTGDRSQRLELLAGILDTDGYLNSYNSFEFSQSNKLLVEQVSQLARGLGFRVTNIKESTGKYFDPKNKSIKETSIQYNIVISGFTQNIPTRVSYKKAKPRKEIKIGSIKNNNPQLTSFVIDRVDRVEYYGFMADGDHRYLLSDNTITHNTWLLLKTAIAAAEQGLTVGIYSGEMSETKVGYRVDTLMSHISNTKIIHGNGQIKDEYKKFLEDVKASLPGKIIVTTPVMIGGTAGVGALRAFIEKYNLDILCIDQHSLLEDDRGAKNPVERASNISKDLKNLQVMKKIPIISVVQQNREKNEDGTPDTRNVSNSDRIGQDATCLISFEQKEQKDSKDKLLTMYLTKSRDSVNGKTLKYIVNFDTGTLIFVPEETDATNGAKCEQLKNEYEDNPTGYEAKPF